MGGREAADMDDEYAKLIRRMNPPRVVIDNDACEDATVIRVDCVKKQGILLEVVQVLTDLNLIITKAYISSDGGWFMDVFNVTDRDGKKLKDKEIFDYIEKSIITTDACFLPSWSSVGVTPFQELTSIELTGTDRPGLLSEVCAILTDLKCNVVKAEVWTHNTRAAAVVHVTDESTGRAIEDPARLSFIKELLCNVLKGNNELRAGKMTVSMGVTHIERRLHQMMFDDRDYERRVVAGVMMADEINESSSSRRKRPHVMLLDCFERDYSVVILRSKDRPKLLFDTVCTLTDMQYVVFHGTVTTTTTTTAAAAAGREMEAYQEYYIRHIDGLPISSEAERRRVIQCLEAAIERRVSEGLELELRTEDRVGLLSDITRIFRENGLSVRRAEISTEGGKAVDTFYVSDMSGSAVEAKMVDSIRRQIGHTILRVKEEEDPLLLLSSSKRPPLAAAETTTTTTGFLLLGNFLKACSFQSFRLIRSYS